MDERYDERSGELLVDLVIRITALERVLIESKVLDEDRFKAELENIKHVLLSKVAEKVSSNPE